MDFEWDEAKRRRNVDQHGFDFLDGVLVLAGEYYCRYSPREGEDRWVAIRRVGGVEIAVVFTLGDETTRIISVRRAKRRERRQYHAHLRRRGLAPD